MKRYFEMALGGILVLGASLGVHAETRLVVSDQSTSVSEPVEAKAQVEPGRGPFDDAVDSDRLLNGHFIAGAGVYIIKPFFQNNPAFFTERFTELGNFSLQISMNQQDFSWGLDAAPVVWLGYVSECGLGVRARWWLFDQRSAASVVKDPFTTISSPSQAGVLFPPPGTRFGPNFIENPTLFVSSNLKLDVWDFEATRETEVGRWGLLFSAGFRYAHLSQHFAGLMASESSFFGFPNLITREVDSLSAGHNFNGAGPTIAIEARRPLSNSGLSLFANLRGAMLFGQSKQQVDQPSIAQTGTMAPGADTTIATAIRDTVLPVAELEMGAQYSRNWGNVRPFVRTGLVAQTWFGAGSASDLAGNLGFLGLSVTAGLTY
jgi:hypothetical protein